MCRTFTQSHGIVSKMLFIHDDIVPISLYRVIILR